MIAVMKRKEWGLGLVLLLAFTETASAGFPWISTRSADEKEVHWAIRADDPIGTRQVYKYGKHWPPYHRPVGPEAAMVHRFHAAHYWPYPYNTQDEAYVRGLSDLHVDAGWKMACTLFEYHFKPETHEISRSGRIKLRWIMANAPEQYRHISVQAADNRDASQARLFSVQSELGQLVPDAPIPPVALRVTQPLGRPAIEIDRIRRAELESQPKPRIEYTTGSVSGM